MAEDRVEIVWDDHTEPSCFYSFWLRLYATRDPMFEGVATRWTDGSNFHPRGQFASPTDRISAAAFVDEGKGLWVKWTDSKDHTYRLDWLRREALQPDPLAEVERITWDASQEFPSFSYDELFESGGTDRLRAFLRHYLAYGIAFISDVPRKVDAIVDVASRFSTVQTCHLGQTFTVNPRPRSIHIGEVQSEIPLHIDLVYKQTPPDLQLLHAYRQIPAGGENEFTDVFRLEELIDPADRELLSRHRVWFVADSETVHFRGLHPVLVYEHGRLRGVRYNEYKIKFPAGTTNEYYFAFERFRELIHRPEFKKRVLLPQDSIVLFDNWRVLHGRRAFADKRRHVVGCFAVEDDLRSTYRVLCQQPR